MSASHAGGARGPYTGPTRVVPLAERREIIERVLSPLSPSWEPVGVWGYVTCPGADAHNNSNGRRDCRVYADEQTGYATKPPGCYCLHKSCGGVLEAVNHRIRSEIGKAKVKGLLPTGQKSGQSGAKTSGSGAPTARTDSFNLPPRGDEPQPTGTTDISKPLVRFMRAHTQAQGAPVGDKLPSLPSAVAQPVAQPAKKGPKELGVEIVKAAPPVVVPTVRGEIEPDLAKYGVPLENTPLGVDVTVIMNGCPAERGRWVKGEWVTIKIL